MTLMTLRRPTLGANSEVRHVDCYRRRLEEARCTCRHRVTHRSLLHELYFTRRLEGRSKARRCGDHSTPSSPRRDVVTHPGVEVPIGHCCRFIVVCLSTSVVFMCYLRHINSSK